MGIFEAATTNNIEELTKHLADGVSVDSRNTEGYTPLHLAIKNDSLNAVIILLTHGANPMAKFSGCTALELATLKSNTLEENKDRNEITNLVKTACITFDWLYLTNELVTKDIILTDNAKKIIIAIAEIYTTEHVGASEEIHRILEHRLHTFSTSKELEETKGNEFEVADTHSSCCLGEYDPGYDADLDIAI